MGGLKAKTDAVGTYVFDEVTGYDTTTTTYGDGSQRVKGPYTMSGRVHECRRSAKVLNPIEFRPGIGLWRDNSYYKRNISDVTYTTGTMRKHWKNATSSRFSVNYEDRTHPPKVVTESWYSDPNFITPSGVVWDPNDLSQATTECLNKLADGKMNMSVMVAESVKAYDGFASLALELGAALLAVKRGHYKQAAYILGVSDPKRLAGRYLEYKYGWKPLMMDLYGSYEYLRDNYFDEDRPMLINATRKIKSSAVKPTPSAGYTGTIESTRTTTVGMVASLSKKYARNLQQSGLVSPELLAWELIPFSFVYDWFLPVGNVIEGMYASEGLTFVSGYSNCVVKSTCQITQEPYPETDQYRYEMLSRRGLAAGQFGMERHALSGFPRPELYTKSPFNTSNAISALALITQLSR